MSSEPPNEGYVDPSIPNPNGPDDAPIIIYGYTPSLVLGILAIVLYALCIIPHAIRLYLHRTWAFSILTLITCAFEIVGYVFRLRSTRPPTGNPYSVTNFVVQYFFIVVAPVFFSAGIYTILTSMISALGDQRMRLWRRRKWIVAVFVSCDVIATIVQVAGAALIGVAESNGESSTTPNNILLAGLAFQVFAFLLFISLLGYFIYTARKGAASRGESGMMQFTLAVVVATLLIYLRTIFRLAETSQGVGGFASRQEGLFGGLEFAPVVLAVGILAWWHPGKFIPRWR
ncbi:MAG: hypothetical protein Q9187_001006 [Circinaria calcarea]